MDRLTFALAAIDDARAILGNLADKAGRSVAVAYFNRFKATFDRLAMFPRSGIRRRRLGVSVRIAVVHPYIVIYRATADDVEIMPVVHGHRRITRGTMSEKI